MASDSLISSRLCRVCFASQTLSFVPDDARNFGTSLAFSARSSRIEREPPEDGERRALALQQRRPLRAECDLFVTMNNTEGRACIRARRGPLLRASVPFSPATYIFSAPAEDPGVAGTEAVFLSLDLPSAIPNNLVARARTTAPQWQGAKRARDGDALCSRNSEGPGQPATGLLHERGGTGVAAGCLQAGDQYRRSRQWS